MSIGLGPHLRMIALGVLSHWCPACGCVHLLNMGHRDNRLLDWDHNTAHPSFTPDIRQAKDGKVCHYFITEGRIHFQADSTHIFAGKSVDLPCYPHSAMATTGAAPAADHQP